MATTGVYPVFNNGFKIGSKGMASAAPADMVSVADLETFSVAIDNGVEEWTPMTTEGWIRRMMTGKSCTITLSGKRNVGDPGNDYVAGLMWKTGADAETKFEWTMPSGTVVALNVVVNVKTAGGDSTNVDALEFDVMSNGKPTIAPAAG